MRGLIQAGFVLATLPVAATALANAANDADYSVSGNVAVVSDYMFRGLTQTWGRPAIQGGGDLAMTNGFAAGFWASSISERSYPGAALELDLYASYGASFSADWSWRAGLYGYVYPGGNLDQARPALPARSFDTLEANAALAWTWLTLKYNRSLTDYFAIDTEQGYRGDSRGTQYVQLDAAISLGDGWSLALHAAHTDVPATLTVPLTDGASDPGYSDFGATLKYQFTAHWNVSLGATCASNTDFYRRTASFLDAGDVRDVAGARGFVMLQGAF
ncbi:MAG TPA: TorF family putative porin [Rudaea sp.]|jgi:uncharacterized protein (TIGR02001 family)